MIEIAKLRTDGGNAFYKPTGDCAGNLFESTLALTPDQIKDGPWEGYVSDSSGFVMAFISEHGNYPGYFHCRAVGLSACETKRPVIAEAVGMMMDHLLSDHGRCCADLKWKKTAFGRTALGMPDTKNTGDIVYFLRAGDFIKIGKATGTPDSRISQLKTGCPFPIEVAATMIGGYDVERSLHKRFAAIRAHGEWFHAASDLLEFISSIGAEA